MGTLYDYLLLQKDGAEVTVLDNVYDIETYFYNQPNDEWDNIMFDLAKKLQIVKINDGVVTVNLSDLIERNLSNLESLSDLFMECDIDLIMILVELLFWNDNSALLTKSISSSSKRKLSIPFLSIIKFTS